jgi:hypothetical protein
MGTIYRTDSARRIGLMGLTLLLLSCSPTMRSADNHEPETKDGTMRLAETTAIHSPGVPLMDAEAPATWETASFGLG